MPYTFQKLDLQGLKALLQWAERIRAQRFLSESRITPILKSIAKKFVYLECTTNNFLRDVFVL